MQLEKFWTLGNKEKAMLSQSLEKLLVKQDELVARFYSTFFSRHPEVEKLFVNHRNEKMQGKIMQTLIYLVRHIDRPNILVPTLAELGKRHQQYGALATHYPIAAEILLDTMGEVCKECWNNEIRSIWKAALQAASRVMLNAYHQGEAQDAGSQNRKENHGQEAAQTAE